MPTYSDPPTPKNRTERPQPPPQSTQSTQRDIDIRKSCVNAAARIVVAELTSDSNRYPLSAGQVKTRLNELAASMEDFVKTGVIA